MILCGYMVQELLCNHLVAPIFGSPRAMFCRNLFEFCILRKWSHLEVLQKAWLLPLGHWVAADSTGPKARRKHKSDAVVSMSSSAAAAVADAAEGAAAAAAAHAPGMDDRLAALKAERQALKRQLQQASREVKAQAGQGTTSSSCAIFVLGVSRLHLTKFAPSFCTYQHLSG